MQLLPKAAPSAINAGDLFIQTLIYSDGTSKALSASLNFVFKVRGWVHECVECVGGGRGGAGECSCPREPSFAHPMVREEA